MTRGCSFAWSALLAGALGTVALAQESAPELPVAEWRGSAVSLEDFRGQVTALVFYDDNES